MNYNSTAIKDILNLTDDDCEVTDFHIEGHTKYLTIEKTKLLTTNKRSQSSLGKYYEFNEATFMLYYKDGTHEAKTVDTTDKKTYDAYMSKLEI